VATSAIAALPRLGPVIETLTAEAPRVAWRWDQVDVQRRRAPAEPVVAWVLWHPALRSDQAAWIMALRLTVLGPARPFDAVTDLLLAAHARLSPARLEALLGCPVTCGPAIRAREASSGLLRGSLTMHIRGSAEVR